MEQCSHPRANQTEHGLFCSECGMEVHLHVPKCICNPFSTQSNIFCPIHKHLAMQQARDQARTQRVYTEQPLPSGEGESVTEALIADLRQREEYGLAKYGQSLRIFDGRRNLKDALDEALDLIQYLKKEIMERKVLEAKLDAVKEWLSLDNSVHSDEYILDGIRELFK